jgi:uncharacterized membrane protein YdjX (TVP38/TMEM64 family)
MKGQPFRGLHDSLRQDISSPGWTGFFVGAGLVLATFILMAAMVRWIYGTVSIEAAQDFMARIGWAGAFVYVIFFVIGSFLLVSATALSVVAPALFGPWLGFVAILVGNIAAAVSIFALTRWGGYRLGFLRRVQARLPERLIRFAHGNGLLLIFAARLLMFPASLVNYASALLPISFTNHSIGTFLGVLPHCLSTALSIGILRDALLAGQWTALLRWETGLLMVTYAVTLTMAYLLKVRIQRED